MNREEIIESLTPVARDVFNEPAMVLSDEMSAENVETWTSLAFMQFLTAIEEKFGFKFKMMEVIQMKTMGDIISAMVNHLS